MTGGCRPVVAAAPSPARAAIRSTATASAAVTSAVDGEVNFEEVAGLLAMSGGEDEILRLLEQGLVLLHEVRRAKAELRQVPPPRLQAALALRAAVPRGASA